MTKPGEVRGPPRPDGPPHNDNCHPIATAALRDLRERFGLRALARWCEQRVHEDNRKDTP